MTKNAPSSAVAWGGCTAAQEALHLWAKCATGGANYSALPYYAPRQFVRIQVARAGFQAAVSLLRLWREEHKHSDWQEQARDLLAKTAGRLLAACKEIEGSNRARAWFVKSVQGNDLSFHWKGTATPGRRIAAHLSFRGDGEPAVWLAWDTATGSESRYLSLPSMTDEANFPLASRRPGGWEKRQAVRFGEEGD